MKKYELIPSDKDGLFRIKALINIFDKRGRKIVDIGTIGGYVSGGHNLSHEGSCWISDNAKVIDYAVVKDSAIVSDNACIYDDARLLDNCRVKDNARVYGASTISGCAWIEKNATVNGTSVIKDQVFVSDNAVITGAWLEHGVIIDGNAVVKNLAINGNAKFTDDAVIEDCEDFIVFSCWWAEARNDSITWTRSNDKWSCGDFFGDTEHLLKFADTISKRSKQEVARIVRYVDEIKSQNYD